MTTYNFIPKTANAKTGQCAALYTSRDTCPSTCPLRGNGCYAENGPIGLAWNRAVKDLDSVLQGISAMPEGAKLRLFPAGDMPGEGDKLDVGAMTQILEACVEKGMTVWGYTHKDTWIEFLLWANSLPGVTIAVSCTTPEEADIYRDMGLPTTIPVADLSCIPELGDEFIPCQHAVSGKPCIECNLCMSPHGKTVCFPVHGACKGKAKKVLD